MLVRIEHLTSRCFDAYHKFMNMTRTTIKVRQELFQRVRRLSLDRGEPAYRVFNDLIEAGLTKIKSEDERRRLFRRIEAVQRAFTKAKLNTNEIYRLSRKDLK